MLSALPLAPTDRVPHERLRRGSGPLASAAGLLGALTVVSLHFRGSLAQSGRRLDVLGEVLVQPLPEAPEAPDVPLCLRCSYGESLDNTLLLSLRGAGAAQKAARRLSCVAALIHDESLDALEVRSDALGESAHRLHERLEVSGHAALKGSNGDPAADSRPQVFVLADDEQDLGLIALLKASSSSLWEDAASLQGRREATGKGVQRLHVSVAGLDALLLSELCVPEGRDDACVEKGPHSGAVLGANDLQEPGASICQLLH